MERLAEEYHIILQIPGVELWEINGQSSKLVQKGNLEVIEFKAYHCFILQINSFKYSLSKEIPILSKKENNAVSYVLPNLNGYYGIKIKDQSEPQIMEVLDIILTQHSSLYYQEEEQQQHTREKAKTTVSLSGSKPESKNESVDYAGLKASNQIAQNSKPSIMKSITTEKVSTTIYKGGHMVKEGLVKAAESISKGLQSGGKYIQTKIKKREVKEVDSSTLVKLKIAKTATNAALTYTKVQVN